MVNRTLVALLVAATPSLVLAQARPEPLAAELLALDRAAARQEAAKRPTEVAATLERLKTRFDTSIHSARDTPQQRTVQYDDAALKDGLALSMLYQEATKDDRLLRAFTARKSRIEGTVLLNQRKYPEAMVKLDAALAEAERLDDVWLQLITQVNRAYAFLEMEQTAPALEACEKARVLADRSDPRSRALAMFNLASAQMHTGNFEAAIPLAEDAATLARQLGNRLWEGNARLNLGVAHLEMDHTAQARAELTAARDVLLKTQDKLGIGRSMYNLAIADASDEAFADAVSEMERALPLIRSVDIRHSHAIEQEPREYYNAIEESALQLLSDWHERLGNTAQMEQYAKALGELRAKRPAATGHRHKPGSR